MRILLDECVNPRVKLAFPDHEVVTVAEAQWRTLPDTKLIVEAQKQFDVFVTIDQGFEFEVNLTRLTIGIVIAHVRRNRIEHYQPLFKELLDAATTVGAGEVVHVGSQLAETIRPGGQ